MSNVKTKSYCAVVAGLLGVLGMAEATHARSIYVAVDGNDTNAGSVDKPLESIQKALDQAAAGDIVRLRGGTYRPQAITLKHGGTDTKPLIIEGMPGEQAVLKGSRVISGWTQTSPGVWSLSNWQINSQQLFADGQPLQQIGIKTRWHTEKLWANNVCLPPVGKDLNDLRNGSYYYDQATKVLYCKLPDGSDPNQHMMEVSVEPFILDGLRASHVVLRNLSFMHSNITASDQRNGAVQVGGSGWLIENCRFLYADFGGLSICGNGHTVRHCQISNNGCVGIDVNGSDEAHGYRWHADREPMNVVLEDLELNGNNYRQFFDQWHAGAMKLVPCCRGVTIRRCRIMDNKGAGIWFDGGLGSNRIEDNLLVDNMTGIFYEIAQPVQDDPFGALIRNNRIINGSRQGIYISASSGAIVENNTCYNNHWDIVLHGMPRKEFGGQRKLEGNVVRNNIVTTASIGIVVFAGENSANNQVYGNFYAVLPGQVQKPKTGPLSVTKGLYDGGICKDPTEAFAKTGMERNGRMGDPGWIDPAKLDFRLTENSPAAGRGWQAPDSQ